MNQYSNPQMSKNVHMVQFWIHPHIYQQSEGSIKIQSSLSIHHISIYSKNNDKNGSVSFDEFSFEAATMAVLATERYFNDLRKDLGDDDFDRLFALHPTDDEMDAASKAVARIRKFRFFTPSISSGISMGKRLVNNIRQMAKERWNKLRWALFPNSNDLNIEDVSFRRRRSLNF